MEKQELINNLQYYTGTEGWTHYSPLFKFMLLTDGAKFLADYAGAYWLMDVIGSHQVHPNVKAESFQVWTLTRDGEGCHITCDDGNDNILINQDVEYTDFPLDEFKLYACWEDKDLIVMLPGEY